MDRGETAFMLIHKECLCGQNIEDGVDDMREDGGKGLTDVAAGELQFSTDAAETEACGPVGPEFTISSHLDGRLQHEGTIGEEVNSAFFGNIKVWIGTDLVRCTEVQDELRDVNSDLAVIFKLNDLLIDDRYAGVSNVHVFKGEHDGKQVWNPVVLILQDLEVGILLRNMLAKFGNEVLLPVLENFIGEVRLKRAWSPVITIFSLCHAHQHAHRKKRGGQ